MVTPAQAPPVVVVHEGGGWWSATAFTAYATFALALITVILAVAAWRSTRHTKRQLDIAEQQADTARRQADTAADAQRASLRQWLSLSSQPAWSEAPDGVLVQAAVQSIGPGWARIDRAHLELPSGRDVVLGAGVGLTPPGQGDGLNVVLPHGDPLIAEVKATEFPTLVVHCTNVHGDDGTTFVWSRGVDGWDRATRSEP